MSLHILVGLMDQLCGDRVKKALIYNLAIVILT